MITVDFFGKKVTKLIVGDNPFNGHSYILETSGKESIVVNIPVKDKGLFTEIVRKFGWACM